MSIKSLFFFILIFFLFAIGFPVKGAVPLDVVINEIAWMGTEVSYNDEWIELYNNTNSPINLEGWILRATDGIPKINLVGVISANGFYLLERTDDTTVPNIAADLIYKGALSNDGEDLKLYDNLNNLIDGVDCSVKWLAGDNTTKQTMEKTPAGWQTSQNPGGTPKAENSVVMAQPEPEPEPELQPEPVVYPSRVFINEILPSPKGADAEEEWIEIFNQNNFEVDLSGWQLTDTTGSTKTYTFSQETIIKPREFLVLSRPTTKITLNNDRDGLKLIQPEGKIIDFVSYEKAPRGQSYNRTESGWIWAAILTPGSANIIPAQETENTEPFKELEKIDINTAPLEDLVKIVHIGETRGRELISLRPFYSLDELTKIKGVGNKTLEDIKKQGLTWVDPELSPPKIEKGTAAVAEPLKQGHLARQIPKSLSIFLIALGLAIFSGVIILILKRKMSSSKI